MKNLTIIPARAGSKGLKGKNIMPLLGKPLISWSIEAALAQRHNDRVIVSTDSEEIAAIARVAGAHVPFIRPKRLASDTASSIDVVTHAIDFMKDQGEEFDLITLLEPTSPQRSASDIDKAIKKLLKTPGAESLVGIAAVGSSHPDFTATLKKNDFLQYARAKKHKRRQDVSDLYFFEGSVYVSYVKSLLRTKSFYHSKTIGYQMPKWKSFEIDDMEDFIVVEALMMAYHI